MKADVIPPLPPAGVVRRFNWAYDVGGGEVRLSPTNRPSQALSTFLSAPVCVQRYARHAAPGAGSSAAAETYLSTLLLLLFFIITIFIPLVVKVPGVKN